MGSDVSQTLQHHIYKDLAGVTLADEDTSSIQTMPIGQSKAMWQCKWCHLVAKFGTNANCAIWLPNSDLMPVAPSGSEFQTSVASRLASLFFLSKYDHNRNQDCQYKNPIGQLTNQNFGLEIKVINTEIQLISLEIQLVMNKIEKTSQDIR